MGLYLLAVRLQAIDFMVKLARAMSSTAPLDTSQLPGTPSLQEFLICRSVVRRLIPAQVFPGAFGAPRAAPRTSVIRLRL